MYFHLFYNNNYPAGCDRSLDNTLAVSTTWDNCFIVRSPFTDSNKALSTGTIIWIKDSTHPKGVFID